MEFSKKLIDVIKEDYNIPKYRCEVVIDTLLSMFNIGEIVNICGFDGKEEGIKFVSKEFPFKYDHNNQSFNIDYLLINESKKTLYLVELKTTKIVSTQQMEKYIKIIDKIKDSKSVEFLIDDFNKIKEKSKQKKKYQIYEDKYLKELKEKGIFKDIDNVELIYLAPKSKDMDVLYKEKGVKHITFENLYEDMKFNEVDENIKWNSIKDVFKFIENNN